MVTLLAWMAHNRVSSNRVTRKASAASCNAMMAADWNLNSVALYPTTLWATSRIRRENGMAGINRSLLFWYFRISLKALAPARNFLFLGLRPNSGDLEIDPTTFTFLGEELVFLGAFWAIGTVLTMGNDLSGSKLCLWTGGAVDFRAVGCLGFLFDGKASVDWDWGLGCKECFLFLNKLNFVGE